MLIFDDGLESSTSSWWRYFKQSQELAETTFLQQTLRRDIVIKEEKGEVRNDGSENICLCSHPRVCLILRIYLSFVIHTGVLLS